MAAGIKPPPYTRELLRLAARLPDEHVPEPNVEMRSPTCGATVRVSARQENGAITAVHARVSACAYGQAATALMIEGATSRTQGDVDAALVALEDWLRGSDAMLPDWLGVEALEPARRRPGRHGAVLLPFRALAKALKAIE